MKQQVGTPGILESQTRRTEHYTTLLSSISTGSSGINNSAIGNCNLFNYLKLVQRDCRFTFFTENKGVEPKSIGSKCLQL